MLKPSRTKHPMPVVDEFIDELAGLNGSLNWISEQGIIIYALNLVTLTRQPSRHTMGCLNSW